MIPRNDGGQPKQIDTKTKIFLIGLSIAFVGGLVLSTFAFTSYQPLNTWASVAKLAFYSLPMAVGLYVMMKGFLNHKILSSPKPEIVRIYFIGIFLLLILPRKNGHRDYAASAVSSYSIGVL